MPIMGAYGEVDSIQCAVEPQIFTVEDGEALTLEPADQIKAFAYPDNCPRGPRYDTGKKLGCITCPKALIDYDGLIEC